MEDIASQAEMSRAALYLQFRNKEDIFRDLARDLHEEALTQAEAAFGEARPLAERLCAAVEAKTLRMMEIAYASPHGSELVDEKNRLCGDLATDSERRFHEMLKRVFKAANESGEIRLSAAGLSAAQAAELFARAVTGLKGPDIPISDYRKQLVSFSKVFVLGLGG
jgi:AcrR family transcriptional regulator